MCVELRAGSNKFSPLFLTRLVLKVLIPTVHVAPPFPTTVSQLTPHSPFVCFL